MEGCVKVPFESKQQNSLGSEAGEKRCRPFSYPWNPYHCKKKSFISNKIFSFSSVKSVQSVVNVLLIFCPLSCGCDSAALGNPCVGVTDPTQKPSPFVFIRVHSRLDA